MEQGTDEWKMARVGKVTASRVADDIAKTKTGYSASRANYMAELQDLYAKKAWFIRSILKKERE